MASVIIGSAIDTKVLQRQNLNKEPNGLETLIEAYSIKTANRDALVPERFTLHSAFSSSSKKYPRMAVDSVVTEEQDGGITQMLVTFLGLTSSTGLPPAVVRLIPTPGSRIFGPPMVIEAEYLTDKSETQFIQDGCGGQIIQTGLIPPFFRAITMPSNINGTVMPSNPREPYTTQGTGSAFKYHGYLQQTLSSERRGLFLVVKVTFAESASSLVATSFSPFQGSSGLPT
jgi:hypothetical protein